ncbi:MAG: phenylalanine--tRNA ligase subunit beta [bacterium]|nr:phenylalanine--tRNA ligase subunit beta [bacterium]
MDILVPDNWLREFLKTEATANKIAECLSLSGPSIEKVEKVGNDSVYSIEVTTNRVDSAGILGIAREAAAILPRFNVKAQFVPLGVNASQEFVQSVDYLEALVDHKLCPRFSAILIRNVKIKSSPPWMQERIRLVGLRPINNIVDISNYLMHELGQPTHTFDYDKILQHKMILRESKKSETLITLDGKKHILPGGDIVIEDSSGRLIDLCGIMGGKNSEVDDNTKNILFFVQTYNPVNIRRTSMTLAQRSEAASLFEKGLDPEAVEITIKRGIDLFVELAQGAPEPKILDLYPKPYREKKIEVEHKFIEQRLGIPISKEEIAKILTSLSFSVQWAENELVVSIPSFRANDIDIPEDIVEEIARLYGYHKLPSMLIVGAIPDPLADSPFEFEIELKQTLKAWGGVEVYTSSLVDKDKVDPSWVLKLKNPLGSDSEFLRLSLAPSLVEGVMQNSREKEPFHLFEVANVYLPTRGQLPEEKMTLAGIFGNTGFAEAKGIVVALLEELRVSADFILEDTRWFLSYHRLVITSKKQPRRARSRFAGEIGQFGTLKESGLPYYEFDVEALRKATTPLSYNPIPKYPAQIEDISLVLPPRTLVGGIIKAIKSIDKQIVSVELVDTYENTRTLRIAYQNPDKTLTDKDVEKIRGKILKVVKAKFRAQPK